MEDSYIFATKFYFINPVDLLSPVIDALIRLEFETYIVHGDEKTKLFKVLDLQSQHIIFISLRNRKEALDFLDSSSLISRKSHVTIKLGAFVYNNISDNLREEFQQSGIEIIPIMKIKENVFHVIRKIVALFNAKNRRKYIRAKSEGKCFAFLQKRDQDLTIRAEIIDISTHTFSCKIDPQDEHLLRDNLYRDVFLSLKGMQIQVSAKLIGHRDEGMNRVFLFSICGDGRDSSNTSTTQKIPSSIRTRLNTFIKNFLTTHIRQLLALY